MGTCVGLVFRVSGLGLRTDPAPWEDPKVDPRKEVSFAVVALQ